MKPLAFFLFSLCWWGSSSAQEIGINLNYQFIQARQWDKATQVYNFSRPFLENEQPLLRHGVSLGVYYLRNSTARTAWGPAVLFSFHRSRAENPNFAIGIHSLLLDLGIRCQYRPFGEENNPFFVSFTPSLKGVMLDRRLNGATVIVGEPEDGRRLRNFGFGFGLNAQFGYDFPLNNDGVISPLIGINFSPYTWASRSEVIFNEATAGDLTSSTRIFGLQGGVIFRN